MGAAVPWWGALPSNLLVAGDQQQPWVWEPDALGSFLPAAPIMRCSFVVSELIKGSAVAEKIGVYKNHLLGLCNLYFSLHEQDGETLKFKTKEI